jgi:GNAT superfamily N-acetyltransferase
MPSFDIVRESKPSKSFRVASVMGKFDLDSNHIKEHFVGSIDIPSSWNVGLIVGSSGTGKTTIARELFENAYITDFHYESESILDDMPKSKSVDEITSVFNSVGFSSPPSWLKPYSALSNGQKMRVDLANALLQDKDLIVFDEFTSVVDRNVAQIGSNAVQKSIRKLNKQFIAVTCHFDIEDWLLPDWVFDTDSMTFRSYEGQKKNRPSINFEILQAADKSIWKVFAKHHYLSHTHNNAANVFVAYINGQLAAFLSVLHFPHPKVKNMKKVHRLVVLPDYQGIGIGIKMLESIGEMYKKQKDRYSIVTSSPSLIHALKKSDKWRCLRFGRTKESTGVLKGATSKQRITTSFEIR